MLADAIVVQTAPVKGKLTRWRPVRASCVGERTKIDGEGVKAEPWRVIKDNDDVEGEGEVRDETEGAVRESAMCARERERSQAPVRAGVRRTPL